MANCINCGGELLEGKRFCTVCGTPVSTPQQPQPSSSAQAAAQYLFETPGSVQAAAQLDVEPPYTSRYAVLGTGRYIGMLILSAIPLVGLILLIVWSFSNTGNRNQQNFARAMLIIMLASALVSILLVLLGATSFMALLTQFSA